MSTAVRPADSQERRVVKALMASADDYVQKLKAAPGSYASRALAGPELASTTGNYLSKAGDQMIGPLGNRHEIVEVDGGSINASRVAGNYAPYLYVNCEGGSDDDLVTIVPGGDSLANRELWLQATTSDADLTLKHATSDNGGNISCPGGSDLVLEPGTVVKMIYTIVGDPDTATNPLWVVVATSAGLAGTLSGGLNALSDVTIGDTTLADNMVLAYNANETDWRPVTLESIQSTYNDASVLAYLNTLETDAWNAITNFGGAVDAWWQASGLEEIGWVRELSSSVRDAITDAATWVGSARANVRGFIASSGTHIRDALAGTVDWFDGTAATVVTNLQSALESAFPNLTAALADVAADAAEWLDGLGSDARDAIDAAATWVGDAAAQVGTIIEGAHDQIVEALGDAGTWLDETTGAVRDQIDAAATWVNDAVNNVHDALSSAGTEIRDALAGTVSWFESGIADVAGNVWTQLKTSYTWLGDNATAVVANLGSALTSAYSVLSGVTEQITENVADWLNGLDEDARDAIDAASDWVADAQNQVKADVEASFSWIKTSAADTVAQLKSSIESSLEATYDWLATGAGNVVTNITSALQTAFSLLAAGFVASDPDITQPDLDMRTYDVKNVDRLFFNSNDGIEQTHADPHITSHNSGSTAKQMRFYVPNDGEFNYSIGTLTNRMRIQEERVRTEHGVTVGTAGAASGEEDNGTIYRNLSGQIIMRSGGQDINVNRLAIDAGTTTAGFTEDVPEGAFWIPVSEVAYDEGVPDVGHADLDDYFGAGEYSIGILIPEGLGTSAVATAGDSGRVWLVWKTAPVTGSSFRSWVGVHFDGRLSSVRSTSGVRYDSLVYEHRSPASISESSSQSPNPDGSDLEDAMQGSWGIHRETDEHDRGSAFVYRNSNRVFFANSESDFGATATTDDRNEQLPATMPVITTNPTTPEALDDAFGVDDGYVGFSTTGNTNYMWAKLNGYWYRLNTE